MMEDNGLKPCPLCGGQANVYSSLADCVHDARRTYMCRVQCAECGLQTLPGLSEDVISLWNTRYSN